jgi:hypothetical protein
MRAPISEETQEQQFWNDDEPVDEDWVGGVGAVDEKTLVASTKFAPHKV